VRFCVLTTVNTLIVVWNVTPYILVGVYSLYLTKEGLHPTNLRYTSASLHAVTPQKMEFFGVLVIGFAMNIIVVCMH
jgi:hypothetical protein